MFLTLSQAILIHVNTVMTTSQTWPTEGKNQALVGVIPYCGEYPGPLFEDKFRSANQMDGISEAGEIKWLPVNL